MNDKPSITADPNNPDAAYAVWTRNEFPHEQAAPPAERSASSREPVWVARTLDGGRTTPGREIFYPGAQKGTLGHQIVVLSDDELVNVFELEYGHPSEDGHRGVHLAAIRSADKGASWSRPTLIADASPAPVLDPRNLTNREWFRSRTGSTNQRPRAEAGADWGTSARRIWNLSVGTRSVLASIA
jgi:hypothetical protein